MNSRRAGPHPTAPPTPRPTIRIPERSDRLEFRAGAGSLPRAAAQRDVETRRWDTVSPAATRIGRGDVPDSVRQLHDERHGAMKGHSERMHRLDKVRITQSLCNRLSLTPWQRDRALGIAGELDLTAFGSQRAVERVALVVIRHVVDRDRQRRLGLTDEEWVAERSPEELDALSERFESIKDDPDFEALLADHGLDKTSLNRLTRTLRDEIAEQGLAGAVRGRNPYRDPHLSDGESVRSGDS